MLLAHSNGTDCTAHRTDWLATVLLFVVPLLGLVAVGAAASDLVRVRPQRWVTCPIAFLALLAALVFDFFDIIASSCPIF